MQLPCFEWENNARENTLSWYNPATLLIGNTKNLSENSGERGVWRRKAPPHTPTPFIFRIDTKYLAVIPPKFEPSLQFQSKSYSDYTLGFFRRGMIAPAKHLI